MFCNRAQKCNDYRAIHVAAVHHSMETWRGVWDSLHDRAGAARGSVKKRVFRREWRFVTKKNKTKQIQTRLRGLRKCSFISRRPPNHRANRLFKIHFVPKWNVATCGISNLCTLLLKISPGKTAEFASKLCIRGGIRTRRSAPSRELTQQTSQFSAVPGC